jgi:hypothetical protein
VTGNDEALVSVTDSAGVSRLSDLAGYLVASLDAADDPASGLRQAVLLDAMTQRALTLAVRQGRASGLTWEQIGDLLGVTRSAAHQRFSKLV